jgi:hypothetical protein
MLDKKIFMETITAMSEMVGKPMSQSTGRIYYEALKDMTDEQFSYAAGLIIRTRKFTSLPMPADFLDTIQADKDALVIAAWDKVINAMARVGAYSTVIFDDPLIHGFIQSYEGGWPGLCATTNEEMVWVRKEFERYYKAINPESVTVIPLVGISEGQNMTAGIAHQEPPVYIGDEKKAQALLEVKPPEANMLKKLGMEE